jgi:hypothetical protein
MMQTPGLRPGLNVQPSVLIGDFSSTKGIGAMLSVAAVSRIKDRAFHIPKLSGTTLGQLSNHWNVNLRLCKTFLVKGLDISILGCAGL